MSNCNRCQDREVVLFDLPLPVWSEEVPCPKCRHEDYVEYCTLRGCGPIGRDER